MKKRLLFISQCYPIPLDGGGRIKTFSTMMAIANMFDIHAVFISERLPTPQERLRLQAIGIKKQDVFLHQGPKENIKKHLIKLIANYILLLRPHYVYQYSCTEAKKCIQQVIKSWKPDIIHVDHLNSAQYVPSTLWFFIHRLPLPKLILENHNVIHNFYYSRYKNTRKCIRKLYLVIEGTLNLLYEFIQYPRFDHIFSISDTEVTQIASMNTHVSVSPTHYPIKHQIKKAAKQIDLLFVGFLDWPPNEEGLRWFLEQSYPLLKQDFPKLSVCVIGGSDNLTRFTNDFPDVQFLGSVKSIDTYLSKAKIFIIPLLSGSGLSIKVLTALSSRIAIVSTPFGIRGYELSTMNQVLLGDTPKKFAHSISLLLKSEQLRKNIAENGHKYYLSFTRRSILEIRNNYLQVSQ